MSEQQLILKIIESVEPELFWLLLKFIGVGVALLVLKGYIESVAAYVQFRLDKRLGLGVKVKIRGIEGKIVDYSFAWILIKHDKGTEIISMKRAKFEKWTLLNGQS